MGILDVTLAKTWEWFYLFSWSLFTINYIHDLCTARYGKCPYFPAAKIHRELR